MADTLGPASGQAPASRPASTRSRDSERRQREQDENTPLLRGNGAASEGEDDDFNPDVHDDSRPQSAGAALLDSIHSFGGSKGRSKWSSVIALSLLCVSVILIMVLGFMTPEILREYAEEAMVFEPKSLSIPKFTSTGVVARIQGTFRMDGSRVKKKSTRNIGRFGTWVAREVKTSETVVEVYLPEFGIAVLGTVEVPSIKVKITDQSTTAIDVEVELTPGPPDGIRQLADAWLQGRLGQVRVRGRAQLSLQSGIIYVPRRTITKTIVFEEAQVPELPRYDLSKLNVQEVELEDGSRGLAVDVSATVENRWPFDFKTPPLHFAISVDNCRPSEPSIKIADARTDWIHVLPKENIKANATGYVWDLPKELVQACPESKKSPLDVLLGGYIRGNETIIYIRGSESPSSDTPEWLTDLMRDIEVPVSLAGRQFGHLIRNFSLADVHFSLPDPLAEPDSDDAQPRVSAKIDAIVNLPEEMNFPVNVSRVRADADVYYHGSKLGRLDLHKWQAANSTRIEGNGKEKPGLAIESLVDDAPLRITNETLFSEILQKLLFGSRKPVILTIKADVDVEIETVLGKLRVQDIPAEGIVPVKPISRGGEDGPGSGPDLDGMSVKFGNLSLLDSTPDSLTLGISLNFTNPTNYSATVPYLDINLLVNDTILGHGTVKDITVKPGNNSNIPVMAVWCPVVSGPEGRTAGKELLSQYLSGFNTTLTVQAHRRSIPSQPSLGRALEHLKFTFPTPRLHAPKPNPDDPADPDHPGDEEEPGHFIRGATMHLISSTAIFSLASPLQHNTLFLTYLNATAFYKDDRVGHIDYDLPFAIPPGITETPRLPVAWNLGSVGYEAIKNALGGQLRLSAKADVGVRLGRWEEIVWFQGQGIGAKIRL